MDQVEIREPSMRLDKFNAIDASISGTESIIYGLVQMSFVTDVLFTQMRHDSEVLAINDEGVWYFIRIASPEKLELLRAIYPFLEGLSLPKSSSTVVPSKKGPTTSP